MRNILIALLLLLWLILGWLYYQDYRNCCSNQEHPNVLTNQLIKSGPILFSLNDSIPKLGEGWPKLKDSLALFISDNSVLEINAMYCDSSFLPESNRLGLSRANEIKKLFSNIADDKIVIVSKPMKCDTTFRQSNFEALAFNRRVMTESIKETEESTLIYFAFNSTQKLNSTTVENYLNDVANRVIKSGENVLLIGHTDDVGSPESNIDLGMKRAKIVEEYLLTKGVEPDKIKATSKGEYEPIGDNATEAGRNKNRRTSLQIIK